MSKLIPIGGLAAIILLVCQPEWKHLTHHKQVRDIIVIGAVTLVLEIVAAVAGSRKKSKKTARPATAYAAAPARRR